MTIPHSIISEAEWAALRRHLGLSVRQAEIVKGLFYGKSREEIARELAVRPQTVGTHIRWLRREFGVSNRLELIVHVLASLRECQKDDEPFSAEWTATPPEGPDR